jgi:hypothetical protein
MSTDLLLLHLPGQVAKQEGGHNHDTQQHGYGNPVFERPC